MYSFPEYVHMQSRYLDILIHIVYRTVRNLKTAATTYESAWRSLSLSTFNGDTGTTQNSGIKRISSLRDLPTLRPRFHTLFAQDTMHDFAEGVLRWFIQRVLAEFVTTPAREADLSARLEIVKRGLTSSLRWPTLTSSELRGDTFKLNGKHVVYARVDVLTFALFCSSYSEPDGRLVFLSPRCYSSTL